MRFIMLQEDLSFRPFVTVRPMASVRSCPWTHFPYINALYTIKEWNATFCTSSILGSEVLSNCLSTVFNCTFRLHYPWGHLSSMVVTSQHSLEFGCHLFHLCEGSLKRVVIGPSPLFAVSWLVKIQDDIKSDKRAGNFDCDGNVHQTVRPLHLDRGHNITKNDLLCTYKTVNCLQCQCDGPKMFSLLFMYLPMQVKSVESVPDSKDNMGCCLTNMHLS